MSNLAKDFARVNSKRIIESTTERDFITLKGIALDLFNRVIALEDMYEQLLKESLIVKK
jgi:hypothetical protein